MGEGGVRSARSSVEQGLNSSHDLLGVEWLGDVTGSVDLAPPEDVGREAPSGQHDDRKMLGSRISSQFRGQVEAVGGCGQSDIQQHEIDLVLPEQGFSRFGGLRLECHEPLSAQLEGKNAQNKGLIVNDQNSTPHVGEFRGDPPADQDPVAF